MVWLRLSGAEESCRGDYDGCYEAALRLCFKLDKLPEDGAYPTVAGKYPTFGGKLVQYEWLTEAHHQVSSTQSASEFTWAASITGSLVSSMWVESDRLLVITRRRSGCC